MANEVVSLKSGALGTLTAAVIGAGMMGLAASEYIAIGPLTSMVGQPVPLLFLIGIVITLPTAISYAMMMRVKSSTGSTFEWARTAFNPKVGAFVGWCILAFYTINAWVMPSQIGLFFASLLSYFGVAPSFFTFALGAVLSIVFVAFIVYPGASVSGKTTLVLAAIELFIMFALAATVVVVKTGSLNFQPLSPHALVGGPATLFQAMIIMILTFIGWDVTSTVAEETTPEAKKRLPMALIATVVIVGLIWAIATFVFEFADSTKNIVSFTSSGLTPMAPIAQHYWGGGALLVDITALTGSMATFVGAITGSSRIAYAMGRDGFLARTFGKLHPRYRTPWNALHVILVSSVVVTLVVAGLIGTYNSYVWIGSCIVFFALVTYLFTNLSNMVYYKRFAPQKRRFLANVLVPIIGSLISLAALYFGFFQADWNAGFKTGQSIVIFCVLIALIGLGYTYYLAKRRPEIVERLSTTDAARDSLNQ